MGDDAEIYEAAAQILKEIKAEYHGEVIATLAAKLSEHIAPKLAFDADIEEREKDYGLTAVEFAHEAERVLAKRGPGYKTPVFKCLEDFERCKKHSHKNLCRAALAICVGKHLIPFVKHK